MTLLGHPAAEGARFDSIVESRREPRHRRDPAAAEEGSPYFQG